MDYASRQKPQPPRAGLVPNPKARLREQVREVARFQHLSERTEETYWQWMKRFIFFHQKRHPRELGEADIQAFLSHLAAECNVAATTSRLTGLFANRFDAGVKPSLLSVSLAALTALPLSSTAADPHDQSGVALEVESPDPKLAKIVLLAGGPSSKALAHEYFAGCALLLDWLKQQPGVWPVLAREWPKGDAVLKGAKCVVYYGDGGGKQPFITPERWAAFGKLMDGGAGLVLLHQAVDFPPGPDAERVKGWLGAVFHADIGNRGHWDMELQPAGKHAVLNGVGGFAAPGDGWLFNLHFAPGATPLLVGAVPDKARTTADAKAHAGRDEVIAWAYQRPGGGRGFGFTGADLHKSWGYESQRRMVVNGILWAAGLEVPAGGAATRFDEADLNRNLDRKETATAKKAAPAKPKAPVKK